MMYVKEGYCEEDAMVTTVSVYAIRECSNKARYRITFDGKTKNVCGTHLRNYYEVDLNYKPIKGAFLKGVEKVEDIKTGKIIYEKHE